MDSCIVLIFGATGDLAKRKLIPALYSLVAGKKKEKIVFVGVAIDDVTIEKVLNQSRMFIPEIDETVWNDLVSNSYYHKLNFGDEEDFCALHSFVTTLEEKNQLSGNRLLFVASPPDFFCEITKNCASSGLIKKLSQHEAVWHRIIYEKPFGRDLHSAREINSCIAKSFYEEQIFRIDHYLTKEVVGNIALVRFTNSVFEPIWDRHHIEQVHIILNEKVCVEGRGAYYDRYGAIRDVVQNHMFELLSLIAMEPPQLLTGNFIRDERVAVLKNLEFVDGILGQYENYKNETDVDPNSNTETLASLLLHSNNDRWKGVPFYLKTGKCLHEKVTEIQIKFKTVELTINVYPKGTFSLSLNAKKPGKFIETTPIQMEFCHSCEFGPISSESYEVILVEAMRGEQSISVRFDEIEYAWRVADSIIASNLPVFQYKRGSKESQQVLEFEKKHGIKVR